VLRSGYTPFDGAQDTASTELRMYSSTELRMYPSTGSGHSFDRAQEARDSTEIGHGARVKGVYVGAEHPHIPTLFSK
jgi:hypothetical protein